MTRPVAERIGPWILMLGLVLSPLGAVTLYRAYQAHAAERDGAAGTRLAGTQVSPRGVEFTPDGNAIVHPPEGDDPDENDWGSGDDARQKGVAAEEKAEQAFADAEKRPVKTGNALLDDVLAAANQPDTFRDPSVNERLEILYALIWAYNGHPVRRPGDHGRLNLRVDGIPTAEALRAWFAKLSYEQRVALDWRFHDPKRYAEFAEQAKQLERESGHIDAAHLYGGHIVTLFAEATDVFISPRDGRPFVIGLAPARASHSPYWPAAPLIAVEAEGQRVAEMRTLSVRSRRCGIDLSGAIASPPD